VRAVIFLVLLLIPHRSWLVLFVALIWSCPAGTPAPVTVIESDPTVTETLVMVET
jgi:hypothetical protein